MPKDYAKLSRQLTVPAHFYKQKNSSIWSIRLVPPRHVQHAVGKKEYRKSTGHADLKRARPVGQALIADKLREWDALARATEDIAATPTILTAELIDIICAARLYSWMRNDDEERLEGVSDEALLEIEGFCELTDKAMRSILAQGKASTRWPEIIDAVTDWCLTMGYDVEPSDPSFPLLVRAFAKVEKESQSQIALRNVGEGTDTPEPSHVVRYRLSDVTGPFEEFKRTNAGKKHLGTTLNAWRLLIDFCGDIPVDSVTSGHIYDFMNDRMHAAEKSWSEQRAKSFGKRVLREIFGFARTTGLMTTANPVDALEVFPTLSKSDEASRRKPRYPFTSAQLNTLFASEWYDPMNSSQFRGKIKADLGARYWVPLIGLFHGNRVSEALQLVASDFSSDGEVFIVRFQTELEETEGASASSEPGGSEHPSGHDIHERRSLKTSATRRAVPVHPTLVELGFEQFVAVRRKDGPNALLFPSSLPNPDSKSPKLGRAYEQAFLRFVRDHLGFGNGYGSHSFRHQLEDRLRVTQARDGIWPAGMSQQYTGRKRVRAADLDVTRVEGSEAAYGNGYPPYVMLPYTKKIDFSDVTSLPKPFREWLPKSRTVT